MCEASANRRDGEREPSARARKRVARVRRIIWGWAVCEGSVSIAVNRNGVEGACSGREVLLIGLLMRPRSDHGRSCKQVTGLRSP